MVNAEGVIPAGPAWASAVTLLARWREHHERADTLLERLPAGLPRVERARCQGLLYGALRHLGRIEAQLQPHLARPPRAILWAVLVVAGYELIEGGADGHTARVVHHAVEQAKTLASPAEARLVNAVVRKLAAGLAGAGAPAAGASVEELARHYSHPDWLVRRWMGQFGRADTEALLQWNQRPAPVYARWRRATAPAGAETTWLRPTAWAGFYEIEPGHWADVAPLLAAGDLYVQDPGARLAVELLGPEAGEAVLDLCAAPGGKSVAVADAMGAGRIVAVDLPGPRTERLKENLTRIVGVEVALAPADLLTDARKLLDEHGLPTSYQAVLLDVPCSNTGVMRHRVDVKWRLQEGDFRKHARQQLQMLQAAARFVAPGGRLVYSTCSLDAEENEGVADAFRNQSRGAFDLLDQRLSRPWETQHDGAAAFLLRRRA